MKMEVRKMQKESSMIVDTVESLEAKIKEVKEAQKIFATYTQEQVDNIFKAAAMAAKPSKNQSCKTSCCRDRYGCC